MLAAAVDASAHGSGLDAYGCHNDRKSGGYHCHRGTHAGQAFGSKAQMLQQQGAGSGNTGVAPMMAAPPAAAGKTTEQRLRELETLRGKDLITPQEYDAKRRAILDAL